MLHNWTYAGWVTSEKHNIAPKTLRGSWEALVTTKEFEHGLAILDKRNKKRVQKRRHNYLLRGLVYYKHPNHGDFVRRTKSPSNTSTMRPGGGTAYYCVTSNNINFLCRDIDDQVARQLHLIQIDLELIPAIRAAYTHDIAEKMGHLRRDER
jgi:hypothetical protein